MSDSENQTPVTTTPLFSNATYDRLKYVALVLLPALGALYFGLGQIWGFPMIEEVVGSITVVDAFLGVLLRRSNQTYKNSDARFDGSINKLIDEGTPVYSIDVEGDPHEVIESNDELTFKVNKDLSEEDFVEPEPPVAPKKRAPRKKVPPVDI